MTSYCHRAEGLANAARHGRRPVVEVGRRPINHSNIVSGFPPIPRKSHERRLDSWRRPRQEACKMVRALGILKNGHENAVHLSAGADQNHERPGPPRSLAQEQLAIADRALHIRRQVRHRPDEVHELREMTARVCESFQSTECHVRGRVAPQNIPSHEIAARRQSVRISPQSKQTEMRSLEKGHQGVQSDVLLNMDLQVSPRRRRRVTGPGLDRDSHWRPSGPFDRQLGMRRRNRPDGKVVFDQSSVDENSGPELSG